MHVKEMEVVQWFANAMAFGKLSASFHGVLAVVKLTFLVCMFASRTISTGSHKSHNKDSKRKRRI